MVRRDRNFAKLAAIFQKLLKRGPRKKIFSDIGPAVHRHLLFFLPFLPPELAEASYAHMAEKCDKIAPGPRGRVYSISFVHERVVWVATVGKHLKGHRPRHRATARLIEDPAMVLAIFPGTPYTIVTDALHATGSNFQNIFFGTPVEVEYFSLPPSA